jgi:hypothetical protein
LQPEGQGFATPQLHSRDPFIHQGNRLNLEAPPRRLQYV